MEEILIHGYRVFEMFKKILEMEGICIIPKKIQRAIILHDIGKITDYEILSTVSLPRELSDDEKEVVSLHSIVSPPCKDSLGNLLVEYHHGGNLFHIPYLRELIAGDIIVSMLLEKRDYNGQHDFSCEEVMKEIKEKVGEEFDKNFEVIIKKILKEIRDDLNKV